MSRNRLLAAFAAVATLALMVAEAAEPLPAKCDKQCLTSLVDRYIAAVVAHDPAQLPLATNVRFTEMGQEMPLGDGLWFTASEAGRYRHYYPDPISNQVGFMATMKENGRPVMLGGRLRVQRGRISEIETVLYRSGAGPSWNDKGMAAIDERGTVDPVWLEEIPVAERASREELIRDANQYFEGLEQNDGKGHYNFAPDCFRVENGAQTTSRAELQSGADFNVTALNCKEQFESGYLAVVTRIFYRRFPIVDVEHGVVFSMVSFDHRGLKEVKLTNGRTLPMTGFSRPSSIILAEAFRIEKGLIRRIEAVGTGIPYKMDLGWANDATTPKRTRPEVP